MKEDEKQIEKEKAELTGALSKVKEMIEAHKKANPDQSKRIDPLPVDLSKAKPFNLDKVKQIIKDAKETAKKIKESKESKV